MVEEGIGYKVEEVVWKEIVKVGYVDNVYKDCVYGRDIWCFLWLWSNYDRNFFLV